MKIQRIINEFNLARVADLYSMFCKTDTKLWLSGEVWWMSCIQYEIQSCKVLKLSAAAWPHCLSFCQSVNWEAYIYDACALHIFSLENCQRDTLGALLGLASAFPLGPIPPAWSVVSYWSERTSIKGEAEKSRQQIFRCASELLLHSHGKDTIDLTPKRNLN